MFIVINVVDGEVGVVRTRDTWNEAVDIATTMASEQCDVDPKEIRAELERDTDFPPPDRSIRVVIAQPEKD